MSGKKKAPDEGCLFQQKLMIQPAQSASDNISDGRRRAAYNFRKGDIASSARAGYLNHHVIWRANRVCGGIKAGQVLQGTNYACCRSIGITIAHGDGYAFHYDRDAAIDQEHTVRQRRSSASKNNVSWLVLKM